LTKIRTLEERQLSNQQLKSLEFPDNALYALLHMREEDKK
jgi:hypothetical protein